MATDFDPLSPGGANVPGFPVGPKTNAPKTLSRKKHIRFSPTVIGVARFSFLRNKFLFGEHTNHTSPAEPWLSATSPASTPQPDRHLSSVSGYTTVGDPITGPRETYRKRLRSPAHVSWVHGKHEFKFGGGYRHEQHQRAAGHRHQRLLRLRSISRHRRLRQFL